MKGTICILKNLTLDLIKVFSTFTEKADNLTLKMFMKSKQEEWQTKIFSSRYYKFLLCELAERFFFSNMSQKRGDEKWKSSMEMVMW